ncbi:MAG: 2Fe-2S iron-sulfur cluster-binding protein [Phycisphaerae bacterium]
MPTIWINDKEVTVPDGTTILQAARRQGIDIPTMCYRKGLEPQTSCFVCVVKVAGRDNLAPSCATQAVEGMRIYTESDEVREARRVALELLLSDHAGDCVAPCHTGCPADMNIPLMIRQIAEGKLDDAIRTVKADIPLPGVLGRVCPAPCEKACRRNQRDQAVSIMLLKRYVADADMAESLPYTPKRASSSGKRVAVVGAGPCGLSAAYYLLIRGHAPVVFEARSQLGGELRYSVDADALPREVLDAEIKAIENMGAEFRTGVTVGEDVSLAELESEYDAVVYAAGKTSAEQANAFGLATSRFGVHIEQGSYRTSKDDIFAGGEAIRPCGKMSVRAMQQGKEIAAAIDQYLGGSEPTGIPKKMSTHIGKLQDDEMARFMEGVNPSSRQQPEDDRGLSDKAAKIESARCLHCECLKPDNCKLRDYSDEYDAKPSRYRGGRRLFERQYTPADVVYESGKCIACGLCVRITEEHKQDLGLTFVGRGFQVQVAVPFDRELGKALAGVADECVEACPTAALAYRK